MNPVVLAAAGGIALALVLGGSGMVIVLRQSLRRRRHFQQRLQRIAMPMNQTVTEDATAPGGSIILHARERRWALWTWIEQTYPLVDARKVFPRAVGFSVLGCAAAAGILVFLRFPVTFWTLPGLVGAGIATGWGTYVWSQRRELARFVEKFPDTVDQVVRMARTGVPVLEAIVVVSEQTPQPVKRILDLYAEQLAAGVDPDTASQLLSRQFRIPELTMFLAVIRLQRRAGGGISAAFINLSDTLRERRKTELKAHASTAQSRFTMLILALLPVLLLLFQGYNSPDSVAILFDTDSGILMLRLGVALVAGGIFVAHLLANRAVR